MCRKGNDLVRGLLWQCAKCASAANGGNPAVRELYLRRLAAGDTPQVAWGYCMTKLLRQVYGIWTSGTEFDPQYEAKKKARAAGPKEQCSMEKEVTAAPASLEPVEPTTRSAEAASPRSDHADRHAESGQVCDHTAPDRRIDYRAVRERVTFAQVLTHLKLAGRLSGPQHRGPCPLHQPTSAKHARSFSVNLKRNVFRCFDSSCGRRGNVLDFWAAYHHLDLYQAARHLTATLGVELTMLDNSEKNRASRPPEP